MGIKCKPCKPLPVRYYIIIMIFFSTYINYTTRSNLSLSITAMVEIVDKTGKVDPVCKPRAKTTEAAETTASTILPTSTTTKIVTTFSTMLTTASTSNNTDTSNATINDSTLSQSSTTSLHSSAITQSTTTAKVKNDHAKPYFWTQTQQGQVLAAYFYGYVPGSLPAGYIAEKVGPFWTLFVSCAAAGLLNSACVAVLIWFSSAGYYLFFTCRLLIGVCGGMVYPALQCLIGRWAPPQERGKFVAAMMGNTLGTCITWQVVGVITEAWGWEWGFHVVSLQHAPYLLLLWFLTADSPEQHKHIKEEELNFIKEAQHGNVTKTKSKPPFKEIFKSGPFWILNILHFGNLFGLYVQNITVPKFMVEYIGDTVQKTGIKSSLPNLVRFFTGVGYGVLGDYLKTHRFNREIVLKVGVVFSHVIPGILVGCMSFVGCNSDVAITLLVLSCAINGAAVLTNLSNPTDLSPNFAGTLFGIQSFVGGTTGFIVPAIVTAMVENMGNNKHTWVSFFILGALVYVVFGIIFIIFGTSKTQPWNEKKEDHLDEPVSTKSDK